MNDYTTVQTLSKIHRELWWTIRLIGGLEVRLNGKSESWKDLVEVEKVLRETAAEIGKIIRRETAKGPNPRNDRPGSDLALKAQLAKARSAVASVLNEREDGPSHK